MPPLVEGHREGSLSPDDCNGWSYIYIQEPFAKLYIPGALCMYAVHTGVSQLTSLLVTSTTGMASKVAGGKCLFLTD